MILSGCKNGKRKFNIDFGMARIAGKIAPGEDLQSRARIGVQVSYAFQVAAAPEPFILSYWFY